VTRLRLISVLTATLALAGGAAGPSRVVESTRLVVSIVRLDDAPEVKPIEVAVTRPRVPDAAVSIGNVHVDRRGSAPVTHLLFQRPPPAFA
jgi:hypothetical protein